jgi:methionyl aminopeptidase
MIFFKSDEEIELLRESSLLVGKTLAEVARMLKPGVKTIALDALAESFIRDHGAVPGFKNYRGYPATLCISINDQVVHGIPGQREIQDGDLVSIDCGTILHGYYGDSAYTFGIGNVEPENLKLMKVTREALDKGIAAAVGGARIGDIGFAVQSYVESHGYSVVRDLVGHGLGKNLHEEPQVPNYGKRGTGIKLAEGLVICIEPMINRGTRNVTQAKDGWTIRTQDGLPSAHYEHTIAVKKEGTSVLSSFEWIEKVENEFIQLV